MIIAPQEIRRLCISDQMINPFREKSLIKGLSGGLSQAGYDVHIAQDVTLYPRTILHQLHDVIGIRRPTFCLASTIEHFKIPSDVMFQVVDKSTWARQGLSLFNTVGEPGWSGYLTLELVLLGDDIVHIKKNDPIAQIIFMRLNEPSEFPYNGKYQNQAYGPQVAIFPNAMDQPDNSMHS